MRHIFRITGKEFGSFFSSPIAFIFIGVFLAASLFVFFWVETFFSRNISEIRPLFTWMPILLIFLSAAVTMRSWAEERRAGTLELLLTSPVTPVALVLGKFFACLGLVALSLLLTLPIPLTVSFMGPLDWGPVCGGYLATLFLAAAYISIGLYVSVKSVNQIVSLIVTVLVCSLFYIIGSNTLVSFFGNRGAEILQMLGSGSRFASITRGVVDLRDLYYYLALMGIFLTLNVYGLEKIRWGDNPVNVQHTLRRLLCGLVIANFLVANFWLAPVNALRVDMTSGNIYSLSETSRNYLAQLKEPLLIRGYFSAQTHPLLAPLVPRIRDLLGEYGVAGGDKVHVEFVDPQEHPDLEQEAGRKYGIRPVPFQTASRYQTSVTNSYFDVLIQYGDQFETLGFRDLIEVKAGGETELDVELRNPEYDITRAIKKVLYSYQGGGDLFTDIGKPVEFIGYISPDSRLPEELVELKGQLQAILTEMEQKAQGLFRSEIVDPDSDGGAVAAAINAEYGFQPMVASLFDERTFWFYLTLKSGEQRVEVALPEDFSRESLLRALSAGLKRFAGGFTRTVALHTPKNQPPMPQYGMPDRGPQFTILQELLAREHGVVSADLAGGRVPDETDLLLVVAPDAVDEKQLFAMDQFLMQGGTVVLATSPFAIDPQQQLGVAKKTSGLEEWLKFHGISIEEAMVLDPQNSAFPVPVERNVGGFTVQETQLVNYPFFVDIRPDGMHQDNGLLTGLNQLSMNWASPITIDMAKNDQRQVTRLLESSANSWLTETTDIQPDFAAHGELGFARRGETGKQLLGVLVEGRFPSFFAGKPSPLLVRTDQADENREGQDKAPEQDIQEDKPRIISRQIDKSPASSRIILLSSNSFLNDTVLGIGSSVMRSSYLNPVQLMANTVDWSLEDRGLLSIRGRGHFSRTLLPMTRDLQLFWEYLNYGLALSGLLLVWLIRRFLRKRTRQHYQQYLTPASWGLEENR